MARQRKTTFTNGKWTQRKPDQNQGSEKGIKWRWEKEQHRGRERKRRWTSLKKKGKSDGGALSLTAVNSLNLSHRLSG